MAEPESESIRRKNLHGSIVSEYLKTIIKNEETTNDLQRQVCDIQSNFQHILKFASSAEGSSCSYEIVTSPVYSTYLGSWKHEDIKRMECPENGMNLFELQGIVENQDSNIEELQTRIMEMRNCFQILLHSMAKDPENSRILADYLGTISAPHSEDTNYRIQTEALLYSEVQRLRSENEMLKQKCHHESMMSDPTIPGAGCVYNIYSPKNVYVQSTKNVLIRKGSIDSTNSSSQSTKITSSASSSSLDRMKHPDRSPCGSIRLRLRDTVKWTQNIQTEYQRTSSSLEQNEDDTRHKLIYGQTMQEEVAVSTMEYHGCEMIDVRHTSAEKNTVSNVESNVTDKEMIDESKRNANGDGSSEISVSNAGLSPTNVNSRVPPDGSSFPTDGYLKSTSTGPNKTPLAKDQNRNCTSALLGLIFTALCDLRETDTDKRKEVVDLERLPPSFIDVLERIRFICRPDFGRLLRGLDVAHANMTGCCGERDELQELNKVLQTWLKDNKQNGDKETPSHIKLFRILSCYSTEIK